MILDKIIFKTVLLFIGIAAIKVGAFYLIAKIKQMKYEEATGYRNNFHKTNKHFNQFSQQPVLSKELSVPMTLLKFYCFKNTPTDSVPTLEKPIPRSEEVESKYTEVKSIFNRKMRNKEMNRDEILALQNFLNANVFEYEKKVYKNNAHAIYVMMKAKDLTIEHLNKIEEFLNSLD